MTSLDWPSWAGAQAPFSAKAAMRRGAAFAAAGQPRKAFKQFARATQRGLAEAQYQVGRCYLGGVGVAVNRSEGVFWLERAARQEHPEAQALLALAHAHGFVGAPDYDAAAHWARRAAERGSAEGQALLAFIVSSGPVRLRDIAQADALYEAAARAGNAQGMLGRALTLARQSDEAADHVEIASLLEKAAQAGLPAALRLLGVMTELGAGVERDHAAAAGLYRRAAEAGDLEGQRRWGCALLQGFGVAADAIAGETWLRRAALAGDAEAAVALGDIYARGGAAPPNFEEAASWFRRAAEAGHKAGARSLGLLYLTGSGVAADAAIAAEWFRIAAGAPGDHLSGGAESADCETDQVAAFNYAVCLSEGIGRDRDDKQAAFWMRKVADSLPCAQFWYGRMLVEGRGVDCDVAAGKAWIARAAASGMEEAQQHLQGMAIDDACECDERGGAAAMYQREEARGGTSAIACKLNDATLIHQATERAMTNNSNAPCACGSGLRAARCCELESTYSAPREAIQTVIFHVDEARRALASGNGALAETHCLQALELAPRYPAALWILYQVRRHAGDSRAAIILLERIVALNVNDVEATQNLALMLLETGDLDAAERHARNAIRLAPESPVSHNLLGMILTESSYPQIGEFHYRRVLELSGARDPILLANLAWNLKGQGRISEARLLYQESVAAAPRVFQTFLGWAQTEEAARNFPAARECLDRAAELRGDDPALKIAQATLLAREGDHIAALSELELIRPDDSAGLESGANPHLLTEKGRILDRLGRYDEAYRCFDEAKRSARRMTGKSYLEREAVGAADRLRRFFICDRLRLLPTAPVKHGVPQPIFILGFPRSGTTLIEQVLCSHPNIDAGDELPFINELSDAMPRLFGSPLPYPDALAELWMGDSCRGLEILRDIYLQKVEMRGVARAGKAWFTDKMPLNEMHLGLIALMFPESPIIQVVRHPLDAVLSAFSHHMTHGYFCAYELETTARHYALVMDLVSHYRQEMTPRLLTVRYEDMIDDIDTDVRRMLDFVGEPFDARCVAFHDNQRLPHTPSYAQVSEKIYDRSRYRYRNYLRHLEPVIPILEPIIGRLGYVVDR